MKWFKETDSLDNLRKLYRKLVVMHHPDNGGSEEIIKEINAEYDILFKRLKNEFEHKDTYRDTSNKQRQQYDWKKDKLIREKVMQLAKFEGIKVEIIGVWIWVSNCYAYRKELKGLGFHWAKQKQMWYLHFDDFHKFSSKPASMDYIREKYGSMEIRFGKEKEDKENNRRIKAL